MLTIAIEIEIEVLIVHTKGSHIIGNTVICVAIRQIYNGFRIHKTRRETFAQTCVAQHTDICAKRKTHADKCYNSKKFFHKSIEFF